MEMDKKIEHFSHHHPLILKEEKQIDETITFQYCSGCKLPITDGPIYVCDQCQEFVLHKSCVGLPKEIQHPFHPQHPLVLLPKSPYKLGDYICDACNYVGSGFVFHCAKCQFDLHTRCASLEPTISYECHDHLLTPFDRIKFTVDCQCIFCWQNIDGEIVLRCVDCNFNVHKSCADQLPKQIQHPFHPHHPLTLKNHLQGVFTCHACKCRGSGFVFQCAECQFDLHIRCASLEPTISYEGHDHLLTPFDSRIGFDVYSLCIFCGQYIYGEIVLSCVACKFNVHKSCADLFPKQIQHPFHPHHPLILKTQGAFTCHACKGRGNRCSFSCDECHFILHIECARLLPNIKCQGHEHLLTLIEKTYQHTLLCNLCGLSCDALVLACVQCDFYIHVHCNPSIPRTIKHECHVDTLTLVDSLVEKQYRGDSNEFYCDACEKLRNPNEPAYYCAECQFMAEIRCVISEVLSPLTVKQASVLPQANYMDSTFNGDEDDEAVYRQDPIVLELEEEVEKLKLEERTITTQLESLTLRLESLTSQSEVLKSKVDDNVKRILESGNLDTCESILIVETKVSRLLKNKRLLEALQISKNDM